MCLNMGNNNQGNSFGRTDFIATAQTFDNTHYLTVVFHLFAFL